MLEKRCIYCKKTFPVTSFHKDKANKDGLCNRCKECSAEIAKKYALTVRGKTLRDAATRRSYFKRREARLAYFKLWYKNNKKKKTAQQKVSKAKKAGLLKKSPCENCGKETSQAHHDDYSKPLEVRWLCVSCHKRWHLENTPTH